LHDAVSSHMAPPRPDAAAARCERGSPWHLLSTGETYTDLGGDYSDKRRTRTAHQRRLVAQLEAMGHRVTLAPAG
jgi:hypothetical protein